MSADQENKILSPQELETEGADLYQSKKYPDAAKAFIAAAEGYLSSGDHLKAAEMANNQSVAWLQAKKPQLAWDAVADTIEIFEKAGDKNRMAMALGNRGMASEALKQYPAAVDDYQASADIFEELGENDLRLNVMQSLSALQLRMGDSLGAVAAMQNGVKNVKGLNWRQRMLRQLLKLPSRFMPK
ncbi:MAG: hypothetical protein ABFS03_05085 [Chloroflexota bacterium]